MSNDQDVCKDCYYWDTNKRIEVEGEIKSAECSAKKPGTFPNDYHQPPNQPACDLFKPKNRGEGGGGIIPEMLGDT